MISAYFLACFVKESSVLLPVPTSSSLTRRRIFSAEDYAAYCGTHCDHIVIPEPHRTPFFNGIRQAVLNAGDRIEIADTYVLRLAKKPLA